MLRVCSSKSPKILATILVRCSWCDILSESCSNPAALDSNQDLIEHHSSHSEQIIFKHHWALLIWLHWPAWMTSKWELNCESKWAYWKLLKAFGHGRTEKVLQIKKFCKDMLIDLIRLCEVLQDSYQALNFLADGNQWKLLRSFQDDHTTFHRLNSKSKKTFIGSTTKDWPTSLAAFQNLEFSRLGAQSDSSLPKNFAQTLGISKLEAQKAECWNFKSPGLRLLAFATNWFINRN